MADNTRATKARDLSAFMQRFAAENGHLIVDDWLPRDTHGFVGRVVDKTPSDIRGATRGEEIAAWLAAHPAAGFVIIDDHADMGDLRTHLVLTQPAHGLQPVHVSRALALLMRPINGSPQG